MCYCNYLNDREDYCGSEACNKVAMNKGFAIKGTSNSRACFCAHNCKAGECKNYQDYTKLKINQNPD